MKKVLIISYYWPPAGGVSVLRNLKFVKYLRRFGWEPVVFAPKNAAYPQTDPNNEKEIPEDIEVIKYPITEPFDLFRKFTGRKKDDNTNPVYARENSAGILDKISVWIRGNFFIPDARALWIKPSVKYLAGYLKDNKTDAILTDGPPHTNTVIGQKISEKTGIPWLADFQDPWTQVDYYKMLRIGLIADRKHKNLEQQTFKIAKQITIASPTWANDLERIGANDVEVIYYGYDEDDFRALKPENTGKFIISHTGLLGIDRNPEILLKVLSDLCKEDEKFKQKLELHFAGVVDFTIKQKIEELGLKDNFRDIGFVDRKKALQIMINSDLLLLLVNQAENAKGRLPGKIYEYLRSYKHILSLGVKNSDVENILQYTGTGMNFDYYAYEDIKKYILDVFHNKVSYKGKKDLIQQFSVKNQTKKLSLLLDNIAK